MRNIALKLMYNGTAYHGWQVQKNAVTVWTLQRPWRDHRRTGAPHRLRPHGRRRSRGAAHIANFRTESRIPLGGCPLPSTPTRRGHCCQRGAGGGGGFQRHRFLSEKEYTYRIYNSRVKNPFMSIGRISGPSVWTRNF